MARFVIERATVCRPTAIAFMTRQALAMAGVDPMCGKRHDKLPPLTGQEEAALQVCAARHGRSWKRILNYAWMGEAPYDDGQVLRKLRNTHGPTWLDRYRLPKRPVVLRR